MDAREVGKLLGTMALYDNRTLSEADVLAWMAVVGDLTYADCHAAVIGHYSDTRERIMPADIRQRVDAVRWERRRLAPAEPVPAELEADHAAYQRWLAERNRAIANNEPGRPQIEAGS